MSRQAYHSIRFLGIGGEQVHLPAPEIAGFGVGRVGAPEQKPA
jgi:hypothetical protein